jgi:hypothetical protein
MEVDATTAVFLDRRAAVDKSLETGIPYPHDDNSPKAEECEEPGTRCAYNRTRGYILGVEVDCGDFSYASLADRLPMLTPKSGAGVWMVPFKGIPATDMPVPLDLIYLDAECRVIEAVEFYPTFQVSPSSPPAASVLALPVHSIYASHTQPGDQVAFGLVEQVEHELARLFGPNASASVVQEALGTQVQEKPVVRSAPAPLPVLDRPIAAPAAPQPVQEDSQAEPWKKNPSKPKSWLQRLLAPEPPEPRKTLRAVVPDLAAYFWTGGAPQPHAIRNISSTGMYVVTEERWYPGTLVQMTLRKADREGTGPEASIALLTRVNRWGNDGVGLGFVVRDNHAPRTGEARMSEAVEREVLDEFLARIGHGKG